MMNIYLSSKSPRRRELLNQILLEADRYIIENIANSKNLPVMGSFILALPLPITDGTEAPMRLIALLGKDT